jgi:hypothetical protein
MPRTRPASVTVIAILHLIFGGLWLLCGLGSLGMQASGLQDMFMNVGNVAPSNNPQLAKQQDMQKQVMEFSRKMSYSPVEYATHVQYVVLSILLILSGIGLLKMAPWGRMLSLVYATLSILSNMALIVALVTVSIPLVQEYADKLAVHGQEGQTAGILIKGGVSVAIILSLVSMIYPVIVLILLFRPSVAAAFRGEIIPAVPTSSPSEHIEENDRCGRG